MIHDRFELSRWIGEFSLSRARQEARDWVEQRARELPGEYSEPGSIERHIDLMQPRGEIIVGPEHLAHFEQLREETLVGFGLDRSTLGPAVPVDVMVWAKGPPRHPACTKIGGNPFRPAGKPWPSGPRGAPTAFMGQICFADSRDILFSGVTARRRPSLPGDVLLIFATEEGTIWHGDREDPDGIRYEWHSLEIEPSNVPVPERFSPYEECHAQIHRSMDYPDVPADHAALGENSRTDLCVFEGGKIGGAARYIQGDSELPGAFLGALGSINAVGPRYPLLNVETNPDGLNHLQGSFLMLGDCGSLYLSLSESGLLRKTSRLHWDMQCY